MFFQLRILQNDFCTDQKLSLLSFKRSDLKLMMHSIIQSLYFTADPYHFYTLTENQVECTIITSHASHYPPEASKNEVFYRALMIDNDHSNPQLISQISAPLAKAGISIFYLSTYQTDYLFVKERRLKLVIDSLTSQGFEIQVNVEIGSNQSPPAAHEVSPIDSTILKSVSTVPKLMLQGELNLGKFSFNFQLV